MFKKRRIPLVASEELTGQPKLLGLLRRRLREKVEGELRLGGRPLPRLVLAALVAGATGVVIQWSLPPVHPWVRAAATLLPFALVYLALTRRMGVSGPLDRLLDR